MPAGGQEMLTDTIVLIDSMAENIYTMQFQKLAEQYVALLDKISEILKQFAEKGYQIDMLKELQSIQNAYLKKDYIELADCLLYELKQDMIELKKMNEI